MCICVFAPCWALPFYPAFEELAILCVGYIIKHDSLVGRKSCDTWRGAKRLKTTIVEGSSPKKKRITMMICVCEF